MNNNDNQTVTQIFYEDLKEKSRTIDRSILTRNRPTQKAPKNTSVTTTIYFNRPISWGFFSELPTDIQKLHLEFLINEFQINVKGIEDYFGLYRGQIYRRIGMGDDVFSLFKVHSGRKGRKAWSKDNQARFIEWVNDNPVQRSKEELAAAMTKADNEQHDTASVELPEATANTTDNNETADGDDIAVTKAVTISGKLTAKAKKKIIDYIDSIDDGVDFSINISINQ